MNRGVAGQALEAAGHIDEFLHAVVRLIGFAHVRVHLQRFVERNSQLIRDHAGDRIAEAVGKVHDAADIADDSLRLQCSKGDDLHDAVRTVFLRDVIDNLLPAFEGEIDVDIRHGHALRVEEPLENQVILNRVEIGDMKAVGDDRARGAAAPGSDSDAVLTREINVVPDNEEVIDIPHRPDDAKLIV